MANLTELLKQAQERARASGLVYEGALTPDEAFELLRLAPGSQLIDVRSSAEIELVGHIPGALHVAWSSFPGWQANPYFLELLKNTVGTESLVMFICRSGSRSHKAAEAAKLAGFGNCYNVLEGFEGDINKATGHRGEINGWRLRKLPWAQK